MQSSCTSERTALLKVWEPCAPQSHSLPPKPRGWMQEDGQAVLLPGRPQEAQGLRGLASQEAVLDARTMASARCSSTGTSEVSIKGNHRVQTELRILQRDDSSYGNSGGGEGMPRQPVRALDSREGFLQLLTWARHCSCLGQGGPHGLQFLWAVGGITRSNRLI